MVLAEVELVKRYLLIVSVLLSLVGCGVNDYNRCVSQFKDVSNALELYATDHGGLYPRELSDLVPDYCKQIPECPAAGADTYSAHYQTDIPRKIHSYHCEGDHHSGLPKYPSYNSINGTSTDPGSSPPVQDCLKRLKEFRAELLAYEKANEETQGNGDLSLPKCGEYFYHFSQTNEGYQFICLNPSHLQEGLLPLQPRLDSKGKLTAMSSDSSAGPSFKGWLPVSILTLVLTLMITRRRRKP